MAVVLPIRYVHIRVDAAKYHAQELVRGLSTSPCHKNAHPAKRVLLSLKWPVLFER